MEGGAKGVAEANIFMAERNAKSASSAGNLSSALLQEAEQAGLTKDAIYDLAAQTVIFNNTKMDVSQKIEALRELAIQAGYTVAQISALSGTGLQRQFARASNGDPNAEVGTSVKDQQTVLAGIWSGITSKSSEGSEDTSNSTHPSSGSGGKSKKEKSSTKDKKLEALENTVELRKSELDLLQEQNAPVNQQIAKMRQIQAALHNEAQYLRKTKGSQKEINELSKEYLEYSKDIQELVKKEKEDKVSLLKSELSLMQARSDSTDTQISKMKQVQTALHDEANYLRSIKAGQADINALSQEYWEITKDINELLLDRADTVISNLDDAEEAALAPLDAQLDVLEAANNARKDSNDLEEKQLAIQEKQLAVKKAQQALLNAEQERTVRYFNASTGQWEWMADAKTVKSAKDSLEDAQKNLVDAQNSLADYYADQAYEKAKATIEKQQEQIKSAYEAFEKSWDDAKSAVEDGSMTLADAYKSMASNASDILSKYSVNLSSALSGLLSALGGSSVVSIGMAATSGNSSASSKGKKYSDYSQAILDLNGYATKEELNAINNERNAYIKSSGSKQTMYNSAADLIAAKKTYDSGGVANGKGLLAKATDRPESVLDPDLTAKLLAPTSNAIFLKNLEAIGAMFTTPSMIPSMERPIANNSSTVNNSGGNLNINGMNVDNRMMGMTMRQFAQSFQTLSLYPS